LRTTARLYLDSVWIKDANPTEAARRGCEEMWLVWCIGNTGVYRSGAFNQYVHMIELSANGGLFEELEHLARAEGGVEPSSTARDQAAIPASARSRLFTSGGSMQRR